MKLLQHISSGFRNYANFRDSSTRAEYWSWIAFVAVGMITIPLAEAAIAPTAIVANLGNEATLIPRSYLIASELFDLVTLVPTLAITVRRFRDAGVSPRWVWLQILNIPLIALVLFGAFSNEIFPMESSMYPVAVQELHVVWAALGFFPNLFPTLIIGFGYGIFQTAVTLRKSRPAPNTNPVNL
ncbi:MAG: DUF805 domain-containing protein [Microbacteriaceae bacterium]